jgi:hypothetical protein
MGLLEEVASVLALQLVKLWLAAGKDPKAEIEKTHAEYSAKAQELAKDWR